MTPRQSRRFFKRLADQIERESRGEPIPGEIASRMTKPVERPLYQCYVIQHGKPTPVGPRASQDVIEDFASAIKQQIAGGREKNWSEPLVVRLA